MKGNYKIKPVLKEDYDMHDYNQYVTEVNQFNLRKRRSKKNHLINERKGQY